MNLVEELQWRGMIHDIMPGTEEQLQKELTAGYVGFDPTSDSLHIGSLVPIMLLVHLQIAGHKPFALVGGATGMVGDPSGKSEERNLLSEDILHKNIVGVQKQLEKFLDFNNSPTGAEIVNNYDWFKNMSFLDFIRDVGKHITVNYMMSKDSVKKRLETGISYTEFAYQLVQGYDFYVLNKEKGCKLQMGGSDQWGNITTGTELIRRKAGTEAFALTCPLIKKADGGKFGKTEKGNIWLDREKTSPYEFYQFWLNTSDEDAESYIKIFTLLDKKTIENIISEHQKTPHERLLQKELAKDITIRVHSEEDYNTALKATQIFFGSNTSEIIQQLTEKEILSIFGGVPQTKISKSVFNSIDNYIDLFSESTNNLIFPSKGEARRMLQSGGMAINKEKITIDTPYQTNLIAQKYLVIQKGKKNNYLITIE